MTEAQDVDRIETDLRSLIRGEFSSIHLTFNNENGPNHTNVRDFFERSTDADDEWVSPEEKARAFELNACWTLQWYPDTPVGCYILRASSLAAIFAALPILQEGM